MCLYVKHNQLNCIWQESLEVNKSGINHPIGIRHMVWSFKCEYVNLSQQHLTTHRDMNYIWHVHAAVRALIIDISLWMQMGFKRHVGTRGVKGPPWEKTLLPASCIHRLSQKKKNHLIIQISPPFHKYELRFHWFPHRVYSETSSQQATDTNLLTSRNIVPNLVHFIGRLTGLDTYDVQWAEPHCAPTRSDSVHSLFWEGWIKHFIFGNIQGPK